MHVENKEKKVASLTVHSFSRFPVKIEQNTPASVIDGHTDRNNVCKACFGFSEDKT